MLSLLLGGLAFQPGARIASGDRDIFEAGRKANEYLDNFVRYPVDRMDQRFHGVSRRRRTDSLAARIRGDLSNLAFCFGPKRGLSRQKLRASKKGPVRCWPFSFSVFSLFSSFLRCYPEDGPRRLGRCLRSAPHESKRAFRCGSTDVVADRSPGEKILQLQDHGRSHFLSFRNH